MARRFIIRASCNENVLDDMTRLLKCAVFVALLAAPAAAQLTPLAEGGARSLALGRATTALDGDHWGLSNPAAWAGVDGITASVFASQAFGMPELRLGAATVALPVPYGVASAYARTYGFEDFRETVAGVGFARAFPVSPTRHVQVGVALRYTGIAIPDFGSRGAVGLSLGVLAEVMPGLAFGAQALNVNRPELSSFDPLESRLDAGLAFRAHDRALILLAASKDLDFPLSWRGGLEVQPVEVLRVRAGFGTEPARFSTGIGVQFLQIRADVAAEHHQVLGWTPAFEVAVSW
jgi:hypothetical protein